MNLIKSVKRLRSFDGFFMFTKNDSMMFLRTLDCNLSKNKLLSLEIQTLIINTIFERGIWERLYGQNRYPMNK